MSEPRSLFEESHEESEPESDIDTKLRARVEALAEASVREGDGASDDTLVHTYALHELGDIISRTVDERFPKEIWVRGEIKGFGRSRGKHQYFELVEKDDMAHDVRAQMPVAIFDWDRKGVEGDLRAAPGFRLEDGIEVRVRGKLDYYGRFGKLSLHIKGIDPAFTIGRMAQAREEVLRRLSAEGLIEANARVKMPLLPLDVGLITSLNSAAHADFMHELRDSPFGFRVSAVDVRVQGRRAESMIVSALHSLAALGVECIALVRGGGSKSDLAAFESEALARAIAAMPVPVITGIGHEIDVSIADQVAHTMYKTPTAAARGLVEIVSGADRRLVEVSGRLAGVALRSLTDAAASVEVAEARVSAGSVRALASARSRLTETADRTLLASGRSVAREAASLSEDVQRLEVCAGRNLGSARTRLSDRSRRVRPAAGRIITHSERELVSTEARVRALDPASVLARGYSITLGRDDTSVRSADGVGPGDDLRTLVATGEIWSRVTATRAETNESPPNPPLPPRSTRNHEKELADESDD